MPRPATKIARQRSAKSALRRRTAEITLGATLRTLRSRYRDPLFARACAKLLKSHFSMAQIGQIMRASAPTIKRALNEYYPELLIHGSPYTPTIGRPRSTDYLRIVRNNRLAPPRNIKIPDFDGTIYQILQGPLGFVPMCTKMGFRDPAQVLEWLENRGLDIVDMNNAHAAMMLHADQVPDAPPLLIEEAIEMLDTVFSSEDKVYD